MRGGAFVPLRGVNPPGRKRGGGSNALLSGFRGQRSHAVQRFPCAVEMVA